MHSQPSSQPDTSYLRHERDLLRGIIQRSAQTQCSHCKGTGVLRASLCLCIIAGDQFPMLLAA